MGISPGTTPRNERPRLAAVRRDEVLDPRRTARLTVSRSLPLACSTCRSFTTEPSTSTALTQSMPTVGFLAFCGGNRTLPLVREYGVFFELDPASGGIRGALRVRNRAREFGVPLLEAGAPACLIRLGTGRSQARGCSDLVGAEVNGCARSTAGGGTIVCGPVHRATRLSAGQCTGRMRSQKGPDGSR
jgi:hypothetical protein